MMFFRVKILYLVLFHGFCHVNCSILGSAKQNVNSIFSRDEKFKNSTVQGHITVNTEGSSNAIDNKIHTRKPYQSIIPVRPIHDEKLSIPIVHTNISQKSERPLAINLTANQEPPKLKKKVYHHFTLEELRQRRKELREKWQARHNILSHEPPHGLLIKSQDPIKAGSKRFEIPHTMKKPISKSHSTEEHLKKKSPVENTHQKKITSLYEPITPRTRRILEHKDEAGLLDSSKPRYLLSARTNSRSTLLNKNSVHSDEGSLIPTQDIKYSTESPFNPNYVNYPFMPDPMIAPMYYWPMSPSTTSSTTSSLNPSTTNRDEKPLTESWSMSASTSLTSTSMNQKETSSYSTTQSSGVTRNEGMDKSSSITKTPISSSSTTERPGNNKLLDGSVKVEEQINRASNKRQGDIRPFGYGPFVETVVSPIFQDLAFQVTTPSSLNILDFKLRSLAEKTTTNVPGPIIDDVVSVKIESSIFDDEKKTDTASSNRNLTHHEKLPYQKPGFGYGKSADQVGSINPRPVTVNEQATIKTDTQSLYTNLPDKKNIAVQHSHGDREKSEEQIEKSSEEVDNSLTDNLPNEKKSYSPPGRSEEKLESEEHSVSNETDSRPPARHGKRSSEHTTSSPGNSAMRIAEETHVHQDWRENLRKAIKDRLLKLSSDSEDK